MSHHNLSPCQSRDLCLRRQFSLLKHNKNNNENINNNNSNPIAKNIPSKPAKAPVKGERNSFCRSSNNFVHILSLLSVLFNMAAVTFLTVSSPGGSLVTEAATVKFDWNKENKLFKSQNPHLVRLHIGDRLEITCAHKSSVIILTERFQDYFSCQTTSGGGNSEADSSSVGVPSSSSVLWSYKCSKLFSEKYRFFRHKFQLPIYRYSSISKSPSFQYGHPYFLIDIGYLDPLPELKAKEAQDNSEVKKDENEDIRRSTVLDSDSTAKSSKLTQSNESYFSRGITTSKNNNNQQIETNKQKQLQYDPFSQTGAPWKSKSDPDAMLMDSTNDDTKGHDQGSEKGQKGKIEGQDEEQKEKQKKVENKEDEEEDFILWNACNQYHMKLPFFVEFRDDNIGGDHYHLPIEDEIKAVENTFAKENHVAPNDVKYNYTYIYKLNPTSETNLNGEDKYHSSRPDSDVVDSSSTTDYKPRAPKFVEFTLMNDTHRGSTVGTNRVRNSPTPGSFPGKPGLSTGGDHSTTQNRPHKVQSTKGEFLEGTGKGIREKNLFGGDVSTQNFMMGDSSEYSSSHVTVEQYEMMRENAAASLCMKVTPLLGVNFYAVTTCLFFGAKWLF